MDNQLNTNKYLVLVDKLLDDVDKFKMYYESKEAVIFSYLNDTTKKQLTDDLNEKFSNIEAVAMLPSSGIFDNKSFMDEENLNFFKELVKKFSIKRFICYYSDSTFNWKEYSENFKCDGFTIELYNLDYKPPQPKPYSNLMLIFNEVPNNNIFVKSANSDTIPILYSSKSKRDLLQILVENHKDIKRLALVFEKSNDYFIEDKKITDPESTELMISFIRDMKIEKIDFLSCDTLSDEIYRNYYETLTKETGVIVGASDDKTGNIKSGGDWVMENTSEDIEKIYFTSSIEYYKNVLGGTIMAVPAISYQLYDGNITPIHSAYFSRKDSSGNIGFGSDFTNIMYNTTDYLSSVKMAFGSNHCLILSDNIVYAIGDNNKFQLGINNIEYDTKSYKFKVVSSAVYTTRITDPFDYSKMSGRPDKYNIAGSMIHWLEYGGGGGGPILSARSWRDHTRGFVQVDPIHNVGISKTEEPLTFYSVLTREQTPGPELIETRKLDLITTATNALTDDNQLVKNDNNSIINLEIILGATTFTVESDGSISATVIDFNDITKINTKTTLNSSSSITITTTTTIEENEIISNKIDITEISSNIDTKVTININKTGINSSFISPIDNKVTIDINSYTKVTIETVNNVIITKVTSNGYDTIITSPIPQEVINNADGTISTTVGDTTTTVITTPINSESNPETIYVVVQQTGRVRVATFSQAQLNASRINAIPVQITPPAPADVKYDYQGFTITNFYSRVDVPIPCVKPNLNGTVNNIFCAENYSIILYDDGQAFIVGDYSNMISSSRQYMMNSFNTPSGKYEWTVYPNDDTDQTILNSVKNTQKANLILISVAVAIALILIIVLTAGAGAVVAGPVAVGSAATMTSVSAVAAAATAASAASAAAASAAAAAVTISTFSAGIISWVIGSATVATVVGIDKGITNDKYDITKNNVATAVINNYVMPEHSHPDNQGLNDGYRCIGYDNSAHNVAWNSVHVINSVVDYFPAFMSIKVPVVDRFENENQRTGTNYRNNRIIDISCGINNFMILTKDHSVFFYGTLYDNTICKNGICVRYNIAIVNIYSGQNYYITLHSNRNAYLYNIAYPNGFLIENVRIIANGKTAFFVLFNDNTLKYWNGTSLSSIAVVNMGNQKIIDIWCNLNDNTVLGLCDNEKIYGAGTVNKTTDLGSWSEINFNPTNAVPVYKIKLPTNTVDRKLTASFKTELYYYNKNYVIDIRKIIKFNCLFSGLFELKYLSYDGNIVINNNDMTVKKEGNYVITVFLERFGKYSYSSVDIILNVYKLSVNIPNIINKHPNTSSIYLTNYINYADKDFINFTGTSVGVDDGKITNIDNISNSYSVILRYKRDKYTLDYILSEPITFSIKNYINPVINVNLSPYHQFKFFNVGDTIDLGKYFSSNSPGKITFSSGNQIIDFINGTSTVMINSAGSAKITISQEKYENYAPASKTINNVIFAKIV